MATSSGKRAVRGGPKPKPVRERWKEDLEDLYEKCRETLTAAIDSKKKWPVYCTNCRHRAYAEVPNVKDQIAAMEFMHNQGLGRPGQADGTGEDRSFVLKNKIVFVADSQ